MKREFLVHNLYSLIVITFISFAVLAAVFPDVPDFLSLAMIPLAWLSIRSDRRRTTIFFTAAILIAGLVYGYFSTIDILMLSCGGGIAALLFSFILNNSNAFENHSSKDLKIYKDIFNTIVDMIVIAENDTKKIFMANEKACIALGYDEKEICNITIDKIHPSESWEFVIQAFKKLASNQKEIVKDIPVKSKDGKVFYVDISAKPFIMSGNKMLLGVFRDITERKKIEDELKHIKFVIDSTRDGIGMATADGVHFYQNKAFDRMFGFTVEEVKKRHPIAAFNDKKAGQEVFDAILAGESWEGEVDMTSKDGRVIPIFLKADSVKDVDGNVVAVLGIHTDISERRKAEKEKADLEMMLAHSQKMESIGRLAGGVAHDFNNLLTAILGNTEIAMNELSPEEKIFKRLTTIKKAAEGAAEIIRQLLAFSRKQIIEPEIIDLNELIEHIFKVLKTLIGENIVLEMSPYLDLYSIRSDPVNIEQIIINLAANARDSMPDGGKLLLETSNVVLDKDYCAKHANVSPGDYVLLTISDTGSGMDEETLTHIFEPFYTTKEKGRGTGLGLATVYGIVKQNNGLIEVYSEVNMGTTFKLYFPAILDKKKSIKSKEPVNDLPAGNETVLLVEDNPGVLEFSREILDYLGYKVIAATSGEEAVKIASDYNESIDLLITDVILPGMNGRTAAETIAAQRPSMKVIYSSGYTAEAIDKHGILDQGLHFIGKPFTIKDLAVKIRELLDA